MTWLFVCHAQSALLQFFPYRGLCFILDNNNQANEFHELSCSCAWHGQIWLMSTRMEMSIDLQKGVNNSSEPGHSAVELGHISQSIPMIVIQLISFSPGQFSWSPFVKLLDACANVLPLRFHCVCNTNHKLCGQCSDLWLLGMSFWLSQTAYGGGWLTKPQFEFTVSVKQFNENLVFPLPYILGPFFRLRAS